MRLQLFITVLLNFLLFSGLSIADSADIEKQYQALFAEGVNAYDKGDYSVAEEKFQKTIEINPAGDASFYNLAMSEYNLGKYDEAAKNLYKSIDLGYNVPPQVEMAMRPYKFREFSVRVPTGHELQFKGSTNCSQQLIIDMLPGIVAHAENEDNIVVIKPKFIVWGDQGKYWQEEWFVETKQGGNKTFAVTLTPTPDGGADYHISPK